MTPVTSSPGDAELMRVVGAALDRDRRQRRAAGGGALADRRQDQRAALDSGDGVMLAAEPAQEGEIAFAGCALAVTASAGALRTSCWYGPMWN